MGSPYAPCRVILNVLFIVVNPPGAFMELDSGSEERPKVKSVIVNMLLDLNCTFSFEFGALV